MIESGGQDTDMLGGQERLLMGACLAWKTVQGKGKPGGSLRRSLQVGGLASATEARAEQRGKSGKMQEEGKPGRRGGSGRGHLESLLGEKESCTMAEMLNEYLWLLYGAWKTEEHEMRQGDRQEVLWSRDGGGSGQRSRGCPGNSLLRVARGCFYVEATVGSWSLFAPWSLRSSGLVPTLQAGPRTGRGPPQH